MPMFTPVQDISTIPGGKALSKYPQLEAFDGIIAFWDFSEPRAPYYSKVGKGLFPLRNAPGSRVKKTTNGPTGNALLFNGTSDYLIIPESEVGTGPLNIGANGGKEVCVLAFAKPTQGSNIGYIAGPWLEDNTGPKRQYGLFWNLGLYGGATRCCFHISRFGGESPNLPYSRDYSANGYEDIRSNIFQCFAGTYDGTYIRSYIDGRFEPYTNYTEPGAPNGEGLTYDKNPYTFTLGLNDTPCEFTVGANKITSGYSNFWNGEISCVLVMNRAPSREEINKIAMAIVSDSKGMVNAMSHNGTAWSPSQMGWNSYTSALCTDNSSSSNTTTGFSFTSGGTSPNVNYYALGGATTTTIKMLYTTTGITGLTTENLGTVKFGLQTGTVGEGVRLALRIGTSWYVTDTVFTNSVAAPTGNDWSTGEVKSFNFTLAASSWRDLTVTPGSTLAVAGSVRTQPLPSGDITAFGWVQTGTTTGSFRFRQLEFITF